MIDKVDLKIGHNSPARMETIQNLVSRELANNLNCASDNPCTVKPASLDIYNDHLADHADFSSFFPTDFSSFFPTVPGTEHWLPGVSSVLNKGSRIVSNNLYIKPGIS